MPTNKNKCCSEVKQHFAFWHNKCCNRTGGKKTGAFLNSYLKDSNPFQPRSFFKTCRTFDLLLKTKEPFTAPPSQKPKKVIEPSLPSTRSERADRRSKVNEQLESSLSPGNSSSVLAVEESADLPEKKSKRSFFDKVAEFATRFHKPFKNLKWRGRIERIDEIASLIIAATMDKAEASRSGEEYFFQNEQFAHEVLNILNCISDRLEVKLGIDLREIKSPQAVELVDDDEEYDVILKNLAYAILGESTGRGYERIRVRFNEIDPNRQLPSIYMLNKDLPLKVVPIELIVDSFASNNSGVNEDVLMGLSQDVTFKTDSDAIEYFSSLSQGQSLQVTDIDDTENPTSLKYVGSKLDGTYLDYIYLMMEKHKLQEKVASDNEDIIVLNSFDGAEGFKSQKNVATVISFSSSVFSPSMINSKMVESGSSFNILTWMQVMAKENYDVMKASLELDDYWKSRVSLSTGEATIKNNPNSRVFVYDIHDGKMIYSLLQHSQWNRKHHPFLLCKCRRSDGLVDGDHMCKMWDNDSYKQAWQRSLRRYNHKLNDSKYDDDSHRSWCDENNFGVTHYGIHPDLFNVETIKFDVFHCNCAIVRRIMNYTRETILNYSSHTIKAFTNDVLKKFWSDYHIYCWNNRINFSTFKGNELSLFVLNSNIVIEFFETKMVTTEALNSLKMALNILQRIFKFITISYIENRDEYCEKLQQFKTDVKTFFNCGRSTFLDGEDVSFYFHCLRFYLPQIAEETFNKHGLGLGIFSMQGFERRNKESKNTLSRFSTLNRKSKYLLVNNVRRLLQVYLHEINAY